MNQSLLKVTFPIEGELLNASHAVSIDSSNRSMRIGLQGTSLPHARIFVNGVECHSDSHGVFSQEVNVQGAFPEIQVSSDSRTILVHPVCDFNPTRRYNFFIDDNSFFLTEIAQKKYASLFDCFYLRFLRSMHEKYGVKVTLNTFFRNDHHPFDMTQMPDSYKSEWQDNAHWLRMAPHAYSEFPDAPYSKVFPEKLPEHFEAIHQQICRFAGEASFFPPVIMHFYSVNHKQSMNYLKTNGMHCFTRPESFWNDLKEQHGREFFGLYDFQHRQLQIPLGFMCNLKTIPELTREISNAAKSPGRLLFNFGTHEQYSFPFYQNYIPNHFERVDTALRLLTEQDYHCVYFNEEFADY